MSLLFEGIARHAPGKVALCGESGALTYGALIGRIDALASQITPGMVLGIALDNGPLWLLYDLAAAKAGAVCIPLPPFFTPEQTDHVIRQAGVTHIVTSAGIHETVLTRSADIPNGTSKITFTSGTTGSPKGVCLPFEGLERVAQSIVERLGADLAGNHLSVLPLSVLLENVAGVYSALMAGCTVHVPSLATIGFANPFAPDFSKLARELRVREVTSAILVPELLRGLMAEKPDLPDLTFLAVGGSKLAPGLVQAARASGLPVYEGYGLSECGSVVALNSPGKEQPGSVGKPLSHVDLSIKDGEIIVHNAIFLGYLKDNFSPFEEGGDREGGENAFDTPTQLRLRPYRAKAFGNPPPFQGGGRNFATGDLGGMVGDGFVSVNGRKKNVLITSYGRNISPEWVESALLTRPEIAQVLVFGDGQPFLSALVVPSGRGGDLHGAINAANAQLPEYAHVREFHIISPFCVADGTLTGTGRPRREAILARYQSLTTEKNNEFLQSAG